MTIGSPVGTVLWVPQRPKAPVAWVQPVGASDAYRKGDRVLFQGATYESVIDANVWSPTAYPAGWMALAQAAGLA